MAKSSETSSKNVSRVTSEDTEKACVQKILRSEHWKKGQIVVETSTGINPTFLCVIYPDDRKQAVLPHPELVQQISGYMFANGNGKITPDAQYVFTKKSDGGLTVDLYHKMDTATKKDVAD